MPSAMYKKGGKALKPVDKEKNPGLAKLPTKVRNKMGFMKKGGSVKKFPDLSGDGKVTMKDVVATSSEIPTNDDYDEHISMPSKEQVSDSDPIKEVVKAGPKIGDLLFAKWAEDEVWYNMV